MEPRRFARLLVCMLLFALLARAAKQDLPVYGTSNGYDSGGSSAMCWNHTFPTMPNTADDVLDSTTNSVFTKRNGTLLPSCANVANLTVIPIDLVNRTMYKDQNFTFRLALQANLRAVNDKINISALDGKSTVFARLQLCDALKHGFCNPMWNTNSFDDQLTLSETDLGSNNKTGFSDDSSLSYKQNNTLLGVDDGILVFSRWIRWTLREAVNNSDMYNTSVDIRLLLPNNIRSGAYFFIGHVVMSFEAGNMTQRIDIAQAIPDNIVEVRAPPKIQLVGNEMKVFLGVVIGFTGFVALAMLVFIVYHRQHPVMRLAQSSFLVVMSAALVIQICFTFTFLPTKDVYCNLSGLLVLLPLTLVAAILVGRVWRVYRTLANVNMFARDESMRRSRRFYVGEGFVGMLTFLALLPKCCHSRIVGSSSSSSSLSEDRRRSLRQTATAGETASLVFFLTLPQFVIQVFATVYYHRTLELQLNNTEDVGRVVCDEQGRWATGAGIGIAAVLYLIAVILAWISRSLPSAFNEKQQIFQSATISTILSFIALSLSDITDEPSTTPALSVFLRSLVSIGVALSVMILILLPKVRRVLSGEKVVVSTLLASRYTPTPSTSTDDGRGETQGTAVGDVAQSPKKHILHTDDPLPPLMERRIIILHQILGDIAEKSGDGRPLKREEFAKLKQEILALKSCFDEVEYMPNESNSGDMLQSASNEEDHVEA